MPDVNLLNAEARYLTKEIENQLEIFHQEKRKLLFIEDNIVEYKEKLRRLKEVIRLQELATDFRGLIDENRERDIIRLKEKLSLNLLIDK